jgi:hypothetical protein
MSNISDAKAACYGLLPAFKAGDCKVVETVLNSQVRNPTTEAKSYVKGYWTASIHFMPAKVLEDGPILSHNTVHGWRCFKANDAN